MRPKSQRSRACNQCRERRVKCDETPEVCQQCRRLNLKCSGPLQGSVIIDMTDKVTKPRARKKKKPPVVVREDATSKEQTTLPTHIKAEPGEESPSLQVVLNPKQNVPIICKPDLEGENAIAAIRWQYRLPMLYQPSRADAYDLAFITHFVDLNKSVRIGNPESPWITILPTIFTKATSPALKLSIRATSMAFYAKVHGDAPILVDSYRWYTVGLNRQRMSLSKLNTDSIPDDEEVLVPIILGLYEVYAGTTATSVFQHLTAACKILGMRGPKNCSSGAAIFLLRAIRVSDAHRAIVFNQPSIFSEDDWMTLPFVYQPKNAHQHLADILLAIPGCINLSGVSGSLTSFFSKAIPSTTDLRPLRGRASQLIQELNDWAERNPHLCSVQPIVQPVNDARKGSDPTALSTMRSSKLILPDTLVAFTAATFEAARLILTLLLHKICPQGSSSTPSTTPAQSPHSSLVDDATISAKAILKISMYFESMHPVGFDFMRSVFPLVIVANLGPQAEEQRIAKQTLDRWGKKRGVGGIAGAWVNA